MTSKKTESRNAEFVNVKQIEKTYYLKELEVKQTRGEKLIAQILQNVNKLTQKKKNGSGKCRVVKVKQKKKGHECKIDERRGLVLECYRDTRQI